MNAAVNFNSDKSVSIQNSLSVGSATLRERVLVAAMSLQDQTKADAEAQQKIMNKIAQDSLAAAIKAQQKQAAEAKAIEQAIAQARQALARVNQLNAGKLKGALAARAMGDLNKLCSTSAGKAQARLSIAQQYQNVGQFWDLQ